MWLAEEFLLSRWLSALSRVRGQFSSSSAYPGPCSPGASSGAPPVTISELTGSLTCSFTSVASNRIYEWTIISYFSSSDGSFCRSSRRTYLPSSRIAAGLLRNSSVKPSASRLICRSPR